MEIIFKCYECQKQNFLRQDKPFSKYVEHEWRDLTGAVNHIIQTQHDVRAEIEPDYNEE